MTPPVSVPEPRRWKHRAGDTYGVIVSRIVATADNWGYDDTFQGDTFDRIEDAISVGFEFVESDDFNVGVWRAGRLVALLWMDEIVDDERAVLLPIERACRV